MKTINQESWNDRDVQFADSENRIADSRLDSSKYNPDDDEDDQNLSDDDLNGRDLDTDGGDEWDEANVSEKDLDEDDLEDNDEVNAELHQVKNDQFGSLGRSITNEAEPDPDEIPEEHDGGNEFNDPNGDQVEQANNDEVSYTEQTEVTPPAPDTSHATLNNIDPTFTDDSHGRQNKRIVDHEPGAGSTTGDHGAYNL